MNELSSIFIHSYCIRVDNREIIAELKGAVAAAKPLDSRLFFVPRIYDGRSFFRSFRDGVVIFDLGPIFGAPRSIYIKPLRPPPSVMNDPLYSAIRESISVAKMRGSGRAGH